MEGITDVQVTNGLQYDTDHRMIRLKMNFQKNRRHFIKQRGPTPALLDKELYKLALENYTNEVPRPREASTQGLYKYMVSRINQAVRKSQEAKPQRKRRNKLTTQST